MVQNSHNQQATPKQLFGMPQGNINVAILIAFSTLGFVATTNVLSWLFLPKPEDDGRRTAVLDDTTPPDDYNSNGSLSLSDDLVHAASSQESSNLMFVAPFPWEPVEARTDHNIEKAPDSQLPKTTPNTRPSLPPNQKNGKIDPQTIALAQHHLAQLEFLAGMTFANGGLRAPPCLCCQ